MKKHAVRRLLGVLCLWWLLALSAGAADEKITVRDFALYPSGKQGVLVANIHFNYQLTDYLRESLLNGVSLQHEVRFDLVWHSDWWFNKTEPVKRIQSELKYHALSRHYQVLRKDTNEHWNFANLASALAHLGTIERYALPVLPDDAYHNNASLYIEAVLEPKDPDNLPLGLSSLFSDKHRLVSQGVLWALTP